VFEGQDTDMTFGMNSAIEDKNQAHGIVMGAGIRGVFGITDLLYNPNKKAYNNFNYLKTTLLWNFYFILKFPILLIGIYCSD